MEQKLHELERRLQKAEAEVRLTRRLLLAALAAVVTLVVAGPGVSRASAARPTRLKAPVEVVDTRGRLMMRVSEDDFGPTLRVYRPGGQPGVRVVATPNGGTIDVNDGSGRPVAQLDAAMRQLVVVGRRGDTYASIGSLGDGEGACVAVSDREGKRLGVLSAGVAGASVQLQQIERNVDPAGHNRSTELASLTAAGGTGALRLRDSAGKELFAAP
jgi:hypothetical protein